MRKQEKVNIFKTIVHYNVVVGTVHDVTGGKGVVVINVDMGDMVEGGGTNVVQVAGAVLEELLLEGPACEGLLCENEHELTAFINSASFFTFCLR